MTEIERPKEPAELAQWQARLADQPPEEVLRWAAGQFSGRVALASSFSLEDQVLVDLIARHILPVSAFTLDTGRLPPQTYEVWQKTEEKYRLTIRAFFPEAAEVEQMVNQHGINLFYQSVELRKLCCGVRKVSPLRRALGGLGAWVCGLRRDQSVTREALQVIEWDAANGGLLKINPLAGWSEEQVREYVHDREVPYNALHDQGYPSIGCACCTRAVRPGEDIRAGRWWWEEPQKKECGLHLPVRQK